MFRFLGATISCFLAGILIGNVFPSDFIPVKQTEEVNNIIVPLGIILMLFNSDIKRWINLSFKMVFSYVLSVIGVLTMSVVLYFVYGKGETLARYSGMMTGTYVGGTPNMIAVKMAYGISDLLYSYAFLSDAIASAAYVLFMMVFASKVLGYILKKYTALDSSNTISENEVPNKKGSGQQLMVSMLLSVVVFVVPVLAWICMYGNLKEMSMLYIILFITVLSILFSFIPRVRNNPWNFKTGDYFFCAFFLILGTLTQFRDISNLPIEYLGFTLLFVLGCVSIHLVLCRLFGIDKDTMIITSAAGIMSAPFIPSIANAIKNKDLVAPGIAVGILGLGLGNFLGILMVKILTWL